MEDERRVNQTHNGAPGFATSDDGVGDETSHVVRDKSGFERGEDDLKGLDSEEAGVRKRCEISFLFFLSLSPL